MDEVRIERDRQYKRLQAVRSGDNKGQIATR